jgi:hypothetical protein
MPRSIFQSDGKGIALQQTLKCRYITRVHECQQIHAGRRVSELSEQLAAAYEDASVNGRVLMATQQPKRDAHIGMTEPEPRDVLIEGTDHIFSVDGIRFTSGGHNEPPGHRQQQFILLPDECRTS